MESGTERRPPRPGASRVPRWTLREGDWSPAWRASLFSKEFWETKAAVRSVAEWLPWSPEPSYPRLAGCRANWSQVGDRPRLETPFVSSGSTEGKLRGEEYIWGAGNSPIYPRADQGPLPDSSLFITVTGCPVQNLAWRRVGRLKGQDRSAAWKDCIPA